MGRRGRSGARGELAGELDAELVGSKVAGRGDRFARSRGCTRGGCEGGGGLRQGSGLDERELLGRGFGLGGPVVELGEQLALGLDDGLGVAGGHLGGGFGGAHGALGLGGEDFTVAGGVGVALGDGGACACGARGEGGLRLVEGFRGEGGAACGLASAMLGEAFGDGLFQRRAGVGFPATAAGFRVARSRCFALLSSPDC